MAEGSETEEQYSTIKLKFGLVLLEAHQTLAGNKSRLQRLNAKGYPAENVAKWIEEDKSAIQEGEKALLAICSGPEEVDKLLDYVYSYKEALMDKFGWLWE